MVNAQLLAMEINSMLPLETPATTQGYEGFYHLVEMAGSVEYAKLDYIVRDHDADKFAARNEFLRNIEKTMNKKYGEGTVTLTIKEQYRNMKEKIEPYMHLIDNAKKAIKLVGLEPSIQAIRGGTDGAQLSFMGLPCPNLGTGGAAYHGALEHISVEGMDKVVDIIVNLIKIYANM